MAANLAKALETTIPVDLRDSSMQALTDLSALFSEAALHYNNNPATHVIALETFPKQPQQVSTTSPRVPSTPRGILKWYRLVPCTLDVP